MFVPQSNFKIESQSDDLVTTLSPYPESTSWTKEEDEKLIHIIKNFPKKKLLSSQILFKNKTPKQISKRILELSKTLSLNNQDSNKIEFKEDSLIEENRENYVKRLRRRNKIEVIRTEIDDSYLYYRPNNVDTPKKKSKKSSGVGWPNKQKSSVFIQFKRMIAKNMPYPVMRWFYCPVKGLNNKKNDQTLENSKTFSDEWNNKQDIQ